MVHCPTMIKRVMSSPNQKEIQYPKEPRSELEQKIQRLANMNRRFIKRLLQRIAEQGQVHTLDQNQRVLCKMLHELEPTLSDVKLAERLWVIDIQTTEHQLPEWENYALLGYHKIFRLVHPKSGLPKNE